MFNPSAKVVMRRARPVFVEVRENFDFIAPRAIGCRREGVLARLRDPKPPAFVEGHVHRLGDVRLGGNELNFKARWQVKTFCSSAGVCGSSCE
jgi:hypothetical protein